MALVTNPQNLAPNTPPLFQSYTVAVGIPINCSTLAAQPLYQVPDGRNFVLQALVYRQTTASLAAYTYSVGSVATAAAQFTAAGQLGTVAMTVAGTSFAHLPITSFAPTTAAGAFLALGMNPNYASSAFYPPPATGGPWAGTGDILTMTPTIAAGTANTIFLVDVIGFLY